MLYLFFIQSTNICLAPTLYYSLSSCLGENRGGYGMVVTHGQSAALWRRPCTTHLCPGQMCPAAITQVSSTWVHVLENFMFWLGAEVEWEKSIDMWMPGRKRKIKKWKLAYFLITCRYQELILSFCGGKEYQKKPKEIFLRENWEVWDKQMLVLSHM